MGCRTLKFQPYNCSEVYSLFIRMLCYGLFVTECFPASVNRVYLSLTDLYRPLGLQEVEAPRISRKSVHEGGKVVSRTHRQRVPPRGYSS